MTFTLYKIEKEDRIWSTKGIEKRDGFWEVLLLHEQHSTLEFKLSMTIKISSWKIVLEVFRFKDKDLFNKYFNKKKIERK